MRRWHPREMTLLGLGLVGAACAPVFATRGNLEGAVAAASLTEFSAVGLVFLNLAVATADRRPVVERIDREDGGGR